jgi:hypothetical protein
MMGNPIIGSRNKAVLLINTAVIRSTVDFIIKLFELYWFCFDMFVVLKLQVNKLQSDTGV